MRPPAVVLVTLALATAVRAQEPSTLAQGQAFIAAGRTREAVNHYRRLVEQYPTWADAHLGLGFACERAGRKGEAKECYERALKVDSREVRAMNNLAHVLIETDEDLPRAMHLLRRATELRPDFAAAWDNLGFAHYKARDFGKATECYRVALQKDPNSASAHYHAGLALLRKEDYNRARAHFEKVVRLDPSYSNAWISLGLAYQKLDRRSDAFTAYQEALKLVNRRSPIGREIVRLINGLGSLYASGGSLLSNPETVFARYKPEPEAENLPAPFSGVSPSRLPQPGPAPLPSAPAAGPARRLILPGGREIAPQAPPPVGLPPGLARTVEHGSAGGAPAAAIPREPPFATGDSGATSGSDHGVIVVRPGGDVAPAPQPGSSGLSIPASESMVKQDLVEIHLRMARLYEQHGLFKDAVSECQTVVNLSPWSKEATEARDLSARLEKKEDSTNDQRIYGLLKLGQVLFGENQIEPAILQYEKVLLLNPSHPIAYKNLAFLNLRAGRLEVAYEQARRAIEIEPAFLEALLIKGHIEARQRRFKESYDTFHRLTELAREGTPIRQYAAGLAQKMRRFIELE